MSKIKNISREELLEDFKLVYDKFKEENPDSVTVVSRDYYREHGKYTDKDYGKLFSTFNQFKDEFLEEEGLTFEVDKKIIQLSEENKQLKRDKDQLLKESITTDTIIDLYREKKIYLKAPIKLTLKPKKDNHEQEAILMLSDFHCGENIVASQIQNINSYDVSIMKKRLDRIFYYTVHYCTKFGISNINLLFLGDLMSGSIHAELMRTNTHNDVECLFILHEYITEKLLQIEPHFNKITCEFIVGNHSRLTDAIGGSKPQYKTAGIINFEYILAKQLKMQFNTLQKEIKEKKIIININDALFKIIEVAKRKFMITHGHIMSGGSSSFAGISYYSLAMNSAKMFGALYTTGDESQQFVDILQGHLHVSGRVKITTGNLYINGSVIGTGEYGLYKLRSVSEPEQTLLLVEEGIVTNELILKGDDIKKKEIS